MASLSEPEQSHLRAKRAELLASSDPSSLIGSWLPRRARLVRYGVAAADASALLDDPRLVPSGLSDPRAALSAGSEVEGYLHDDDMAGVVADFLLSSAGRPNVWLHVVDHLSRPAPLGLVLAELADHDGPREDGQVLSLLEVVPE